MSAASARRTLPYGTRTPAPHGAAKPVFWLHRKRTFIGAAGSTRSRSQWLGLPNGSYSPIDRESRRSLSPNALLQFLSSTFGQLKPISAISCQFHCSSQPNLTFTPRGHSAASKLHYSLLERADIRSKISVSRALGRLGLSEGARSRDAPRNIVAQKRTLI